MIEKRVVIIGGGLSGLTTAYLLAPSFRVTLLEAEDKPGGQARAYKIGGRTVEHGSHAFFGYYKNSTALLDALGTRDLVIRIPGWTIVDAYGREVTLEQVKWLPNALAAGPSILRVPWFDFTDKVRALWGAWKCTRRDLDFEGEELDRYTSEELGRRLGYSDIGVWTWNSASLGLTNLFVNEQSGAIFVGKHRVLLRAKQGLSYLLPSTDLSDVLANPLHRAIAARGGDVILGARATGIERLDVPKGEPRVRVTYGKGSIDAHYAIVALQPWDAAALIPWRRDPWMELRRVTPVITMTMGLSGRIQASPDGRAYGFSREQWAFSVVTDLSRFWPEFAGDKTVLRVEVGHADRLPGGAEMDKGELVAYVKRDLERFWPEAAALSVEWAEVYREEKHLYVSWTRGEFSKKPRSQDRDLGHGIYLAGDWTTRGTIGMEAAVNSAHEAANFVLAGEGRDLLAFEDVPI